MGTKRLGSLPAFVLAGLTAVVLRVPTVRHLAASAAIGAAQRREADAFLQQENTRLKKLVAERDLEIGLKATARFFPRSQEASVFGHPDFNHGASWSPQTCEKT